MTVESRALVTNGGSRIGVWTVEALAASCTTIVVAVAPGTDDAIRARLAAISGVIPVEADCTAEAGWQALAAQEAIAASVDIIVHCPPPALDRATGEDALIGAWLAVKYAQAFTLGKPGILLAQCIVAEGNAVNVDLAATLEGLRIAMPAGLLDALKAGRTIRMNRLCFPVTVDAQYLKATVQMMTDDRSTYFSGSEISLSPVQSPPVPSSRLDGKTVLVTGATSGIGRQTAIEIGRAGGFAVVVGRRAEQADETVAMVRAVGGDAMAIPFDVADEAAWAAAVETVMGARGAIHGLINNAGRSRSGPITDLAGDDLAYCLGVNYRATMVGMDLFRGPISASGGGSIVNISSVAGMRGGFANSVYGGSRGAMIGMSCTYGLREGHPANVRVNTAGLGVIWSGSVERAFGDEGAAAFRKTLEPKVPLGRVGQSDEIARTLVFLMSDASAAIANQAIAISGGLELTYPYFE